MCLALAQICPFPTSGQTQKMLKRPLANKTFLFCILPLPTYILQVRKEKDAYKLILTLTGGKQESPRRGGKLFVA